MHVLQEMEISNVVALLLDTAHRDIDTLARPDRAATARDNQHLDALRPAGRYYKRTRRIQAHAQRVRGIVGRQEYRGDLGQLIDNAHLEGPSSRTRTDEDAYARPAMTILPARRAGDE